MTVPREWRNIRTGAVLIRLRGGKAILSSFTQKGATVTFYGGPVSSMSHDQLYRNYKPL